MRMFALCALVTLCACSADEEDATGTTEEEAQDYGEFCDNYCVQGLADVDAAGCDNPPPSTQDDVDSCVQTCVAQTSVAACAEVSVTFWQCTLDEYAGNYTCDASGNVVQPDSCSAEQQAVLDCFNS